MRRAALLEHVFKTPLSTSPKVKPAPSLRFVFWAAVRELKILIPLRPKLFTQRCA